MSTRADRKSVFCEGHATVEGGSQVLGGSEAELRVATDNAQLVSRRERVALVKEHLGSLKQK